MKTNKNAFRILSIVLSLIMIICAIPALGVMAEDTATEEVTEAPEYYFWDKVEMSFVSNGDFFTEGEDGSVIYNRSDKTAGADFGLKLEDGTMFTLSPNTSYRLSFKYKVTALYDETTPYISFYPGRYATERGYKGDINAVEGMSVPLEGTETAAFLRNEAVRVTSVMEDFETYTVNFTTNSLKRTINGNEWTYDDLLFFTRGIGSVVYDDFEIAEITAEQLATENYDKAKTYYTQNNSTYVDGGMSTTYATSIYEHGILKGTSKGGTQVRFNNPSNAGILGFYFDGEYQLEPSTTYTIRFRAYANEIYTTDEASGSTEGVYVFPAVGHKPNSANKINRLTTLYAAHSAKAVWSYNPDSNVKSQRPFVSEEKVLKTYEHTFTTPATFNTDATDGTCNYFMIALLGKGYDLYIDRIEIAKVTGSTAYYPNLNGAEYTKTPNNTGVTVKRSLVMDDAVVKPLELSGCADADMSNFEFTGWYSDPALETAAVNDTAACYAAWDIAKDYTVTRDFATAPFVYEDNNSKDVISHVAQGIAMSDDNGKAKVELSSAERYYVIRDNNYKNFKLYPDSVYKIELDYELAQDSNLALGLFARFHVNLYHKPTTLLTTADSAYALNNDANASGKLVYYFSTNDFAAWSDWQVGQYVDTLSLTIKGTGAISFSTISVTAMTGDSFPSELTFGGEAATFVIPNKPGTATRYALTIPADGSSISVHTDNNIEVDTLGLTVNGAVLFETSDDAGKVYTAALNIGDKIAFSGYHKTNSKNAANFGVVAAQTVDYPDTDAGVRFRIRSSKFVVDDAVKTYYNGKVYTVVNYGIKVGESFVKDDIAKADALKSEGTDISLAEASAYHTTDTYTDYTLAVKDVDEDKYLYVLGYMVLTDDDDATADITVYTKNVLVNSYADLQNGTECAFISISQK